MPMRVHLSRRLIRLGPISPRSTSKEQLLGKKLTDRMALLLSGPRWRTVLGYGPWPCGVCFREAGQEAEQIYVFYHYVFFFFFQGKNLWKKKILVENFLKYTIRTGLMIIKAVINELIDMRRTTNFRYSVLGTRFFCLTYAIYLYIQH